MHWLLFIGAGLCATFGQLLLTRGYAHAPAAQVGPYHYTAVLFAAAYGWTLWGEVPDAWGGAGALLICTAGIIAARRTGLPVATMYSVVRRGNAEPEAGSSKSE
jgi:drug/metabolite transporter (DMT)-like permease